MTGTETEGREVEQEVAPRIGVTAGRYLTDGMSLFRVVHDRSGLIAEGCIGEIENCLTLDLILCTPGTLAGMKLRPVTPHRVEVL